MLAVPSSFDVSAGFQTEIKNLHAPIAGHQDIVRFQVAMNNIRRVCRRESIGDLHGQIEQLARAIHRCDRSSLDILHDQVIRANVIELANIRMV